MVMIEAEENAEAMEKMERPPSPELGEPDDTVGPEIINIDIL